MRLTVLVILILLITANLCRAQNRPYALSLYGGQLTTNHFEDFFESDELNFKNSYLLAIALAQHLGQWDGKLSYELEGQVVKHVKLQNHWEFNLLGVVRWEKFVWDNWLDTSTAFGLGASYATKKPKIEIENDGETAHLLVYWMLELAVVPFKSHPQWELITRIHHRSDAFGLVADDGGSNALAFGLKYHF